MIMMITKYYSYTKATFIYLDESSFNIAALIQLFIVTHHYMQCTTLSAVIYLYIVKYHFITTFIVIKKRIFQFTVTPLFSIKVVFNAILIMIAIIVFVIAQSS